MQIFSINDCYACRIDNWRFTPYSLEAGPDISVKARGWMSDEISSLKPQNGKVGLLIHHAESHPPHYPKFLFNVDSIDRLYEVTEDVEFALGGLIPIRTQAILEAPQAEIFFEGIRFYTNTIHFGRWCAEGHPVIGFENTRDTNLTGIQSIPAGARVLVSDYGRIGVVRDSRGNEICFQAI